MRIPQRVSFGLSFIALCAVLPACGKSATCARTSDCAAGLTCQRSSGKCVDPNSEGATTGDQSTGSGTTGGTTGSIVEPGVAPAENELIITEVAPQRAPIRTVPNGELEFIELFNVSNKKLDLSGLSLVVKLTSRVKDPGEDPGVETVLPLEGTLEANARLVVARNGPLLSEYYPQAQVLHRPSLRLNTIVHQGSVRVTYLDLKVLLKSATQTLDESNRFNDGALDNAYLAEPYPATKALRSAHSAWRKYGSLRGVSRQDRLSHFLGDNTDRNVESWGTPGAGNESTSDSIYKDKLVFTQISASNPDYRGRQARNAKGALVGIGAGVYSSMDLIEIRNVSTETIDVIGMVLEQHTTHYNYTAFTDTWAVGPSTTPGQSRSIVSPLVIGKTPVKRTAPNGLAGADAANRAHLNLAPGESVVLARNPDVVIQAMIQKRVSAAAPFTSTELTSLGVDSAYRITAGLAGYHSGYVIPATIALGSQRNRNYVHFVLRDRQGNKIDQAGGLGTTTEWGNGRTVPNGFHKMGRGGVWHADLSKSRASRGNWFPVGNAGFMFGKPGQLVTAAQCGDIISVGDRTCFLIGLVMQEFP